MAISSYIAAATYLLAACGRSFALCPQPFALPHDSRLIFLYTT
jgi:hypothetical protein